MNTFEFVRCSKNDVSASSSQFNEQISKSSESLIKFDVGSFEAKNRVFEFDPL